MVQLWLTFKALKPVSTVQFINSDDKNIEFVSWIKSAGLVFVRDKRSEEFGFVSKNIDLARRASEIMWSETKDDLLEKGELFGYPKLASTAFAQGHGFSGIVPNNFPHYWAPYVRYAVREAFQLEDSLKAKVWADEIRKDAPILAEKFEKEMENIEIR